MKKLLSFVLAAVMLFATFCFSPAAFAEGNDTFTPVDSRNAGSALPFTDVPDSLWSYSYIFYGYNSGLINGMDGDTFAPELNITRGMLATLIGRYVKVNIDNFSDCRFTDVDDGMYYAPYIEWAAVNSIVSGMTETTFEPDSLITRQQFAKLMYNYAVFKNVDVSGGDESLLAPFDDKADIASWAYNEMIWCVHVGLFNGLTPTTIVPGGIATRAQAATLLYRFINTFMTDKVTEFKVSSYFSDDMIIQRAEIIRVWGFADADQNGKTIYASLLNASGSAVVENGKWTITLDKTLAANSSQGNDLKVWGEDGTEQTFKNVLVGDVYMIAGQSNVYYSLDNYRGLISSLSNEVKLWLAEYTVKENTNIRLFRNSSEDYKFYEGYSVFSDDYGTIYEDVVQQRGWQKPWEDGQDFKNPEGFSSKSSYYFTNWYLSNGIEYTPQAAEIFSALGYLFAEEMIKSTEVPIGMIEIDASGFPICSFLPNEICDENNVDYIDYYTYPTTGQMYFCHIGNNAQMPSRFAFNQQIYPILNASLAGIIWYQGESDSNNTEYALGKNAFTFTDSLAALTEYLRGHFANSDIPLFIIEFPGCWDTPSHSYLPTGNVRSELGTLTNIIDNSYIVSSSDLFSDSTYSDNVHPYCKLAHAQRLSELVLAVNYGKNTVENKMSPVYESASYSDTSVTVSFANAGAGLEFAGGEYVGGIEIRTAKNGQNWVSVDASQVTLSGNTLVVTNNTVIWGIRYNAQTSWYFPANVNLQGKNGLPVVAFVSYRYQ